MTEVIPGSFVIKEHLEMALWLWCVRLELGSILPGKFQITDLNAVSVSTLLMSFNATVSLHLSAPVLMPLNILLHHCVPASTKTLCLFV